MTKTIEVHTGVGWIKFAEDDEISEHVCNSCPEPAAFLVSDGVGPDGNEILWTQCQGCCNKTHASYEDARRAAKYDCRGRADYPEPNASETGAP